MGRFTVHFSYFTYIFTQVKGRYASQSELYILQNYPSHSKMLF